MLRTVLIAATSVLLLGVTAAHAAVTINGTRVIYEEQRREAVIKISNTGTIPVLLQSWIDQGDPAASPETIDVPFNLSPPVARLDPDKEQTIRLFRIGGDLPADRESLYWFNLLEIPPKAKDQGELDANLMQLAFRTRIKLFYRPEGLGMVREDAYKKLTFSLKYRSSGAELAIDNASPYYLTLSQLDLRSAQEGPTMASLTQEKGKMVAPFATLTLPVAGLASGTSNKLQVFYTLINDFGGETPGSQTLTP